MIIDISGCAIIKTCYSNQLYYNLNVIKDNFDIELD